MPAAVDGVAVGFAACVVGVAVRAEGVADGKAATRVAGDRVTAMEQDV